MQADALPYEPPGKLTMEYLLSHKKEEIMPFAAIWMQLEIIRLSEISQKEKDKYHIIPLICGI